MKKTLFIFVSVLLAGCSGDDEPFDDSVFPLQTHIYTYYNFNGTDFGEDYDRVIPFTYHLQVGDKVYLCVTTRERDPITHVVSTGYPPVFSVATLKTNGNWAYDPPIMLSGETTEIQLSMLYYGSGGIENCLAPDAPLFCEISSMHQVSKELAEAGAFLKLRFYGQNTRMLFTGVGKGKKIWFNDEWTKNTMYVDRVSGKRTSAYAMLQPNYIETDVNGEAAVYAYLFYWNPGNRRIAITDANAPEPGSGDAAWVMLSDIWQRTISGVYNHTTYNYVVDCSGVSNK